MRNDNKSPGVGIGNVHVVISLGHKLILKNVGHVLSLRVNLFSSSKMDEIDSKS